MADASSKAASPRVVVRIIVAAGIIGLMCLSALM
jgi:hypothetical protein